MKKFTKEQSLVVKGVAIMLLLLYHLFHEKALSRDSVKLTGSAARIRRDHPGSPR